MIDEKEVKADMFAILSAAPDAYWHVRKAILDGRIDGMYPNCTPYFKCGCIKAHVADFFQCCSWELPGAAAHIIGSYRTASPAERFIYDVRFDSRHLQTPTTSRQLGLLLLWVDEWKAEEDAITAKTLDELVVEEENESG